MKNAKKKGDKIYITFDFNWDTISQVKSLIGRKYLPKEKAWTAPLSQENLQSLKEWGFQLDSELEEYLNSNEKSTVDKVDPESVPKVDVSLQKTPYPYQTTGISWLEANNGRGLIADEMGLGKTLQAIGWLSLHPEKRPVIIVVPASLKLNWKKELFETLPEQPNVEVLRGMKPYKPTANIIIINYDIISQWIDELINYKPEVVITDESHYYKNNKAKRTKAVKKLVKKAPHFIALSGTPITNRPIEFYNVLSMLDNNVVGSFWNFAMKYCDAKHDGFGWNFNGASNTKELHEKINGRIMIRRKKFDVLTQLPDKVFTAQPMEINNRDEYNYAEEDFTSFVMDNVKQRMESKLKDAGLDGIAQIDQQKLEQEQQKAASKVNVLTQMEKLKQVAVKGKMKATKDWISDFLQVNGKLVVFATHKFVIDELMQEFNEVAVKVDGSTSQEQRHKNVQKFQQNDEIRLFVGNMKAAGTGITLTAASNVAFVELPNTPGDLDQAADRVHRIGQEDNVTVYYLTATNTIEEEIASLIDEKRKVLDSVLDGQEPDEGMLINEILKKYGSTD